MFVKDSIKWANRLVSVVVATLFVVSLFSRCASIGSPEGGPRDSLPPVIVQMTPDNLSTNVDPYLRRIYIEFDEFVQLKDQQSQFFTSPTMKTKPQLQIRGRGVVVTLRDTLAENTTYALNFGSSIQDNNEGNPLYSMRYVFSTGSTIDSMFASGYVEDSYKMDSVSGAYILFFHVDSVDIHPEYDSTLFNSTPAAIARAETNGIFLAQNLKPMPYYIYALDDTNNNFIYEPGTDRVGFIDKPQNPADLGGFAIWYDSTRRYVVAEPQLHLRTFTDRAFQRQLLIDKSRPQRHQAILNFGANYPEIDSIILDSIPEERLLVESMTKGRDTLSLWFDMPSDQIPDTLRGRLVYFKHDSLGVLSRTSEPLTLTWTEYVSREQKREREQQEEERLRAEEAGEEWVAPEVENPFKVTLTSDGSINPESRIIFDFPYPLTMVDTTALTLRSLSAEAVALREELMSLSKKEEDVEDVEDVEGNTATTTTATMRGARRPFKFVRDTMNMRRYYLDADWGEVGSEHYLEIMPNAFTDVAGYSNDSITREWTPLDPAKYATLVVNVLEDKSTPSEYILELLDGSGFRLIERKTGIVAGATQFNYVPEGEVSLRVIQDLNGNGVWDSGDLIIRRQPELSKNFEEGGERVITTKMNWEIEITVDPEKLFAPETQADLIERLEQQERQRQAAANKSKVQKRR